MHGNLHIDSIFSLFSVPLIVRHGTLVVPQTRLLSFRLLFGTGQRVYEGSPLGRLKLKPVPIWTLLITHEMRTQMVKRTQCQSRTIIFGAICFSYKLVYIKSRCNSLEGFELLLQLNCWTWHFAARFFVGFWRSYIGEQYGADIWQPPSLACIFGSLRVRSRNFDWRSVCHRRKVHLNFGRPLFSWAHQRLALCRSLTSKSRAFSWVRYAHS